ncbi:MAG: hypothetical protein ABL956_01075 [Hyphomonadaceae bacterium]
MLQVIRFTRRLRAPLQAEFSSTESNLPDEFSILLEMADRRINQRNPHTGER